MIYTLSWLPGVTLLGVVMMFLIVTVLAMAAVLAAVLFALAIVLALALIAARASVLGVRAARRRLPRPELAPRPAPLVNPRLHRAR